MNISQIKQTVSREIPNVLTRLPRPPKTPTDFHSAAVLLSSSIVSVHLGWLFCWPPNDTEKLQKVYVN